MSETGASGCPLYVQFKVLFLWRPVLVKIVIIKLAHKSAFSATVVLLINLCIFIGGTIFLRWLLIIFSDVNYFNLSLVKFFIGYPNEFSYLYGKLFLTGTTNYFLLLVVRIIFSLALRIIFHGIVNLFFVLQYLAGLRMRGTGSSTFPLDFFAPSFQLWLHL